MSNLVSRINSALISNLTPNPKLLVGKVGDLCDSCSLNKPNMSVFSYIYSGKKVIGDLNDYL